MSRECVLWSETVIAAENLKNSTRRQIPGLSCHSLALSPPSRANVPLLTRHFLPSQSSHPAIEIPPISLKTINEIFFNRHTFALFFSSGHTAICSALLPASLPPCLSASEFLFRYSTHPGRKLSSNSMKTLTETFPSRHTIHKCNDSEGKLKGILDQTKIVNRYTRKLEIP